MEFGWRIVVGTLLAFFGSAFGSGGGVGGAGIFVPMLTLIIGFDTKSSAAISKCMVVGSSLSSVSYNINERHPTLEMPIIDYDLALLFQPMVLLGISIGVTLNVVLSEWMVTLMLIVLCIVTSATAYFRGINKWKKDTIQQAADRRLKATGIQSMKLCFWRAKRFSVGKTVRHNAYHADPYAQEFGIKIDERLGSVDAHVLPPPWWQGEELPPSNWSVEYDEQEASCIF